MFLGKRNGMKKQVCQYPYNLISQDQRNSKRDYLKKQGRVSKAFLKLDNKKS